METLIYILLGIAILFFQAHSQKKQREKRQSMLKGKIDSEVEPMEEISHFYDDEDPYLSILNKLGFEEKVDTEEEEQAFFVEEVSPAFEESFLKPVTESIVEPLIEPIAEPSAEEEPKLLDEIDTTLFILYSELAKPKYLD